MFQRIQSWDSKLLSRAGKAVILKNVAQTIPSYAMSCFMIPRALCQEIERMMNAYWWRSNSSTSKGINWLAWTRMTMSKSRGGLGFRDLHGFNLALLAKQCWNLINKLEALVSRVLKAKYYPDGHLLQATRRGGASYTWSGIWEVKEELNGGLRWVLGDGRSICIGKDKWLRGKKSFCVDQQRCSTIALNSKVRDFFEQDGHSWDETKVRLHFSSEDANFILKTRIPQVDSTDRLAWVHTKDGHYTVRSGYQHWHKNHVGDGEVQQSEGWNKILRVKVPHRIKIFLWRFCRNNIAVRVLLRGRGVPVPIGCDMCT